MVCWGDRETWVSRSKESRSRDNSGREGEESPYYRRFPLGKKKNCGGEHRRADKRLTGRYRQTSATNKAWRRHNDPIALTRVRGGRAPKRPTPKDHKKHYAPQTRRPTRTVKKTTAQAQPAANLKKKPIKVKHTASCPCRLDWTGGELSHPWKQSAM